MNIIKTNLNDCYIIEPDKFGDSRGYFSPYFINKKIIENNLDFDGVVQANRSLSSKGTVRGLHYQKNPKCQSKIVEVINGAAIDIVVDIRTDSTTFGKWTSVLLTPENGRQLFVPKGFAHGFISLKDNTLFQYLVDNDYTPELEDGILWNDPELGIEWKEFFKEYEIETPLLSEKDQKHKTLSYKLKNNEIDFKRGVE